MIGDAAREVPAAAPAPAAPPIERVLRPIREFIHLEAASGVVLLVATALALAWANSPWAGGYTGLWQTELTIGLGGFVLTMDLLHWINDGLMALFFFVVGLEIKREVLVGELASPRQAALPIAAAAGGMALPALIYTAVAAGSPGAAGWGIPMATDIAFALGVLALLGSRVPLALKVFLTALAVVDDLGAVLVIALFYTPDVSWSHLAAAAAILAAAAAANRLGVRQPLAYALLGSGLWLAVLLSGVHATVAGVLLALTIPAQVRVDPRAFVARGRAYLDEFEQASAPGTPLESSPLMNAHQQAAIQALEMAAEQAEAPLQRLEHFLHPWVAFLVMPLFALANAGVGLGPGAGAAMGQPVALGVAAGLLVGKQVGVTLFSWLAIRTGLGVLPPSISWRQIYGAGWLAGIGFTMALFIANLAFDDAALLAAAKIGILAGSLVAGVAGWLILGTARPAPVPAPAAPEWPEPQPLDERAQR